MSNRLNSSLEKCSILGGNVKLEMCSPLSIHFLALNKILMYLLVNFAAGPDVGHRIVDNLAWQFRVLYQGINKDNLLSKQLVLVVKVLHSKRKWF